MDWLESTMPELLPVILENLEKEPEYVFDWIYPGSLVGLLEKYAPIFEPRRDEIRAFMEQGRLRIYLIDPLFKKNSFVVADGGRHLVKEKEPGIVGCWIRPYFAGARFSRYFKKLLNEEECQRVTIPDLERALSEHSYI